MIGQICKVIIWSSTDNVYKLLHLRCHMWIRQSVCLAVLLSSFQHSVPRHLSANFFKCMIASEIILLVGMCKAEFKKKKKKWHRTLWDATGHLLTSLSPIRISDSLFYEPEDPVEGAVAPFTCSHSWFLDRKSKKGARLSLWATLMEGPTHC